MAGQDWKIRAPVFPDTAKDGDSTGCRCKTKESAMRDENDTRLPGSLLTTPSGFACHPSAEGNY